MGPTMKSFFKSLLELKAIRITWLLQFTAEFSLALTLEPSEAGCPPEFPYLTRCSVFYLFQISTHRRKKRARFCQKCIQKQTWCIILAAWQPWSQLSKTGDLTN